MAPATQVLLTIIAPETAPGLEAIDAASGLWVRPFETEYFRRAQASNPQPDDSQIFCVLAGEVLGYVSGHVTDAVSDGSIQPAMHRVVDRGVEDRPERLSMIGLIYAADHALLNPAAFRLLGRQPGEADGGRDGGRQQRERVGLRRYDERRESVGALIEEYKQDPEIGPRTSASYIRRQADAARAGVAGEAG